MHSDECCCCSCLLAILCSFSQVICHVNVAVYFSEVCTVCILCKHIVRGAWFFFCFLTSLPVSDKSCLLSCFPYIFGGIVAVLLAIHVA